MTDPLTTRTPATFHAFAAEGWSLRALNPKAVPEPLRRTLADGIPARVPGEAMVDLLRAGLIADPFDADHETAVQWVGDVDWCYAHVFDWQDQGDERHDLVAYGLDTIAQVRLNGRPVGHAENCFRTYRWDVRDHLCEGRNELEICLTSPVAYAADRERRHGYYPHAGHAFNQIRKPGCAFGWDWGIDVANSGIWRPIGLDSWSGARLESVKTNVTVGPDGTGYVRVVVGVERAASGMLTTGPDAERNMPITVTAELSRQHFRTVATAVVEPRRTGVDMTLAVPNPQLWWPRGYGDQPLYDLNIRLDGIVPSRCGDEEATVAGCGGGRIRRPVHRMSGERHDRIGIRTIELDTAADEVGRPFRFVVNGVPIHARGYNWIPARAFISQIDGDDYRRAMRDLTESNANMVRIWGGGIYEADLFYDLADEFGMLVWQDFMLACAAYPEDAEFAAQLESEAREQIVRLMTHPSLALWNGSNECRQAYAGWDGYRRDLRDDDREDNGLGYGERGWGDRYYAELLPRLLHELDPTRYYLPSSPMSLSDYAPVNLDTDGTTHIWDIWNAADYRTYAAYRPRFADEYGYQAPPAWSTLARVVHDVPLDPFGPQMLAHQKATLGNEKLALGMRSHLTPGSFHDVRRRDDGSYDWLLATDRWQDAEDWHWACQLQQAQAIRFGTGHMRAIEPVNAGALIWQLNDGWPVISWSAVDVDGHRKPMWYAARECFRPRFALVRSCAVHPRPRLTWERYMPEPDSLELVVVNDTRESWRDVWQVRRMNLHTGEVIAERRYRMAVEGGSVGRVLLDAEIAQVRDSCDEIVVADPVGGEASDCERAIYDPVDVIDQHLDVTPFDATVQRSQGGYVIHVAANRYVRDLFCMADKADPQAYADQGMVSLLPGESLDLTVHSTRPAIGDALKAPNVLRCANDLKRNGDDSEVE